MATERHDQQLDRERGEYWACERPEAPPAAGIWWDERCSGCVLMYDAAIANGLGTEFVLFVGRREIPMVAAPIRQWRQMGIIS